jgi:hypothetical protein
MVLTCPRRWSRNTPITQNSEVRSAEELTVETRLQTKDGATIGRPGDVAITAYGGEI